MDLSVNDWLDGIQKTVRSSIQEAKDRESQGEWTADLWGVCLRLSVSTGVVGVERV